MNEQVIKKFGLTVALILVILFYRYDASAQNLFQDEKKFFTGKVITFLVGYKTGGGYDLWARVISPGLKEHTGATIVVKNMPGAGSLLATNKLYVSDPNGLTIAIINGSGAMQAQLTGISGAKFDLFKVTWLGRLTSEQRVVCVGSKSDTKSIEAMIKSKQTIKFGASGSGSPTFLDISLFGKALNIKSEIVTGYETGNEVNLAVIRGELDATAASFSSVYNSIKNKDLIPILQYGDVEMAELSGVPNITDLKAIDVEGKQLVDVVLSFLTVGRAIIAPPGLSSGRADFLAYALKKSLEDKQFREIAEKRKMEISYLPPLELKKIIEKGLNPSPAIKEKVIEIMGR